MAGITPIVMPKWGLSMREGTLTSWLVSVGDTITVGMPILEVETDKISNEVEAADAGTLRRKVANEGEVLPVKALLGVLAGQDVSDADIDAFVAAWVMPAVEDAADGEASVYQFAEVEGIRVRYTRRGPAEGTPVVLIHGYGGDADNWMFNIDALAERAPVLGFDLPGHGSSSVKLPGRSVEALARFSAAFLDALEIGRAHFVGHSLGGAIAAQIALDAPHRVASLTLIGSAGFGDEISGEYVEGFANAESRKELKPVLEMLFADSSLVTRKMIDDVLKYKRLDGVGPLLRELAAALFPGGRQTAKPGLALGRAGYSGPVQVIWGRKDRVVPAGHADAAPAQATKVLLDDAGHMVQMEKSAEVNRAILALVGR